MRGLGAARSTGLGVDALEAKKFPEGLYRAGLSATLKSMYRDNVDALAARVEALEAQLEVEVRRRLVAEAEARAAEARAREGALHQAGVPPLPPLRPLLWPIVFVVALSMLASIALSFRPSYSYRGYYHHRSAVLSARARALRLCPYIQQRRRVVLQRLLRAAPPKAQVIPSARQSASPATPADALPDAGRDAPLPAAGPQP